MKISARNKLHGTIVDVTKGATTAHVRIDLGGGATITASITNEAVDELKLKKGKNSVILKVANGNHPHGFYFTLLTKEEKKMTAK